MLITPESRRFALASVAKHPNPTEEETRQADGELRPPLRSLSQGTFVGRPEFVLVAGGMALLIYVALPALLAALLFRGGLILRAAGVAVVRGNGSIASRGRMFWRGLLAWSPFLLSPILIVMLSPGLGTFPAALVVGTLVLGLLAWSVSLPNRSWPDRLARTWLVPR